MPKRMCRRCTVKWAAFKGFCRRCGTEEGVYDSGRTVDLAALAGEVEYVQTRETRTIHADGQDWIVVWP